jgi:DNA-binding NarL/FixJ family response regulator
LARTFSAWLAFLPTSKTLKYFTFTIRHAIAPGALEKFGPDLVVCSTESFYSILKPPAKVAKNAPSLTPRRRQMAELVSKGLSNPEIARVLGISPRSVRSEMSNLLMLFEASNRTELAAMIVDATDDDLAA